MKLPKTDSLVGCLVGQFNAITGWVSQDARNTCQIGCHSAYLQSILILNLCACVCVCTTENRHFYVTIIIMCTRTQREKERLISSNNKKVQRFIKPLLECMRLADSSCGYNSSTSCNNNNTKTPQR